MRAIRRAAGAPCVADAKHAAFESQTLAMNHAVRGAFPGGEINFKTRKWHKHSTCSLRTIKRKAPFAFQSEAQGESAPPPSPPIARASHLSHTPRARCAQRHTRR